jgi:monovalent cation:proton antiporter-2 (CPA2) family protein
MSQLLVYLVVMVAVVPLSKRLGLGSVIGYLVAGALIGPRGLDLLRQGDSGQTGQIAEFGVIMMLLLIGLELNPSMLWKMRGPIFGLGTAQVAATVALFSAASLATGLPWQAAVTIGMVLSVSSTAIVMQTLQEKGYAKTLGGERAFSVLLFQDIAVIPILAVMPFLASSLGVAFDGEGGGEGHSPAAKGALIFAAVVGVIVGGRYLMRPLFRAIAKTKLRETFTALALLIVVGSAALMHAVGVSPALGAFLAGVVLADSEFRHQIEADIEPFKGLLLGLFFITVGAGIDLRLLVSSPLSVAGWVLAIILAKAAVVYGIGRASRIPPPESLLFAAALAQGGEFAFVLIGQAGGLLTPETAQMLTTAVAISMALAPLLIALTISQGMSRLDCVESDKRAPDTVDESDRTNPVLVIGVGRFGQTLIRFLRANDIACTVLDIDSEQIDIIARFGIRSYFGDGANMDLLRAAGIGNAQALVIAIDEWETTIKIVEEVRVAFPDLPIYCRAYDRIHAYRLLHLGICDLAIETSGSALALGVEVLRCMGASEEQANRKAMLFKRNNDHSIHELAKQYHELDRDAFIQATRQMGEQLEAMLRSDPLELTKDAYSDWHPGMNR